MSEMEVPKGWNIDSLKTMCDFYVPMRDKPTEFDGDIPWLRIDEINEKFTDGSNAKYRVSKKIIQDMKLRVYPIGTVLCSCSASIGTCSITTDKLTTNQTFIGIFPKNTIYNEFLYYYLKANIQTLTGLGKGTTILYISRKKFENLLIVYPDLQIQKKIVQKLDHILKELKEKKKQIFSLIEQNKERIKFFEKNWVTFLIDDEIKNHPQSNEWKLTKLGDIGEYKYGYNGKATSDNSGKPYLRITDINFDGSLKPNRVFVKISDDDFERHGLKNNDIVIARTGATVGKSFLFNEGDNFVFASYLIRYRCDTKKIFPNFLYYVLQSHSFWKYIGISQSASAQPNVNATKMGKFVFNLPPIDIQKKIVRKIKNAEEKFQSQKTQFKNINENYESRIKYINHIQSSILDSAFTGKLVN